MTPNILSTISLILFLFSKKVFCENRKYQYLIVNAKLNEKDQQRASITIDSLSPTASLTNHGLDRRLEAVLIRTWKCPGVTGRKFTCNPKKIFKN